MDREEVFTIILQAKDKLSNVMRGASKTVQGEVNKMRKSFSGFGTDADKLDKSVATAMDHVESRMSRLARSIKKSSDESSKALNIFRKNVASVREELDFDPDFPFAKRGGRGGVFHELSEGLEEDANAIEKQARRIKRALEQERLAVSPRGIVRAFREGRGVATEREANIREQIASSEAEAKIRKKALEESIRARKELAVRADQIEKRLLLKRHELEVALSERESKEMAKREEEVHSARIKNIELETLKRKQAFDRQRAEIEEEQRQMILFRKLLAEQELIEADSRSRDRREQIRESTKDKKLRQDALDAEALALKQRKLQIRATRDEDIRLEEKADDALKKRQTADRDRAIKDFEEAARDERAKDRDWLEEELDRRAAAAKNEREQEKRALEERIRIQRQARETRFDEQRASLTGARTPEVIRAEIERTNLKEFSQDTNVFTSSARKAGLAFGDFRRGIRAGKGDLRTLTRELLDGESRAAKFGIAIGRTARSLGTFVNLRWFLLISFIQLLGHAVVVLGSNLVSLAASATLAAAALGTALAGALAQVAPVAALFAAAMSRVGVVMDAVKKAEQDRIAGGADTTEQMKTQREAAERLADSHWTLKLAKEAVTESEYDLGKATEDVADAQRNQIDAIKDLAEARRDAARSIIDANFEEREAALGLRDAELSVLDAKLRLRELERKESEGATNVDEARAAVKEAQERLRIAKEQGDQFEISTAHAQLAIAQQNLSGIGTEVEQQKVDLKQAQVDVKQAELAKQQAVVRDKRAKEDAKRARQEGIAGNEQVIAAQERVRDTTEAIADAQHQVVVQQRALRDTIHAVTIAQREVGDATQDATGATKKQTAAQKQLQDALADMSPAERKLFKAMRRLQAAYKKAFRPITDIINSALADAIDEITTLIQDPRVLKAFRNLARQIASAVRELAKFVGQDSFIDRFAKFTDNAARNIPTVTSLIKNLTTAFFDLADAGQPLFDRLLGGVDRIVGKGVKSGSEKIGDPTTRRQFGDQLPSKRSQFLDQATSQLDKWLKLAEAIGRVFRFLIMPAAPAGGSLVVIITDFFNRMADWLRDNPEKTQKFFEDMLEAFRNLASLAGRMGVVLFNAFKSDEAAAFSKIIVDVVIPGIVAMIYFLGLVSKILLGVFGLPVIGPIIKYVLILAVAEKALNRIFPISQKATEGIRKLSVVIFKDAIKGFVGLRMALAKLIITIRFGLIPTIVALGKAILGLFLNNPILIAIAAIVIALILLDRKFHFIVPTLKLVWRAFKFVLDWVKTNWRRIIYYLLHPMEAATKAVKFLIKKFIGFFKEVIDWAKDNWKLIIAILLNPIGTAIYLIEKKFHIFSRIFDFVRGLFTRFVDWVKGNWKTILIGALSTLFSPVGAIATLFGKFKDRIVETFKGIGKALVDAFKAVPGKLRDVFSKIHITVKKWHGVPVGFSISYGDSDSDVKAPRGLIGPAGNAGRTNERQDQSRHREFAVGGEVGGGGPTGRAVPIIAHAGEWVLNKMQQNKLAQKLNMSAQQAKAWLFGTNMGKTPPGPKTTKTRPTTKAKGLQTPGYNLVAHTDEDDNIVWFIEFADRTFGQVSARDAGKIKASNGNWMPGYVRRQHGGAWRKAMKQMGLGIPLMASGGVVPSFAMGGVSGAPSFANGGVVVHAPAGAQNKQINQRFEVQTQGETDWNYVMRLAAIHAQASY